MVNCDVFFEQHLGQHVNWRLGMLQLTSGLWKFNQSMPNNIWLWPSSKTSASRYSSWSYLGKRRWIWATCIATFCLLGDPLVLDIAIGVERWRVCKLYFWTSDGCIDIAWHPLSTSGLKLTVCPSLVTSIPSRNNPFNGFLNRSWAIVVGDGFLISVYALQISWLWDGQWAILSVIFHELKFKVWESTLMEEASAAFTCPFCQNANLLWLLLQSLLWLLLCCFLQWRVVSSYILLACGTAKWALLSWLLSG